MTSLKALADMALPHILAAPPVTFCLHTSNLLHHWVSPGSSTDHSLLHLIHYKDWAPVLYYSDHKLGCWRRVDRGSWIQMTWTNQREKNQGDNDSLIRDVISPFDSMLIRLYCLNKSWFKDISGSQEHQQSQVQGMYDLMREIGHIEWGNWCDWFSQFPYKTSDQLLMVISNTYEMNSQGKRYRSL